jgi:hypothetical protein
MFPENPSKKLKLFKPKDISTILGMSIRWVYEHAKELGGFKLGGQLFFDQEGIENAIQRGKEMAGKGYFPGRSLHLNPADKKRSQRLGNRKDKRAEAGREEEAARHGLARFLGKIS